MKVIIFLNGSSASMDQTSDSFVIACDGAWDKIDHSHVKVNLLIGDLDSLVGHIPNDVYIIKFPKEKDDTDAMLAIRWSIKHNFNEIEIRSAFGGRLDHQYANLQACAYASLYAKCTIDNRIFFIHNSTMTFYEHNLSIFSFSDKSTGVNITGAKYELHNETITNTFPIGISNERTADKVTVSVKNGILIVLT